MFLDSVLIDTADDAAAFRKKCVSRPPTVYTRELKCIKISSSGMSTPVKKLEYSFGAKHRNLEEINEIETGKTFRIISPPPYFLFTDLRLFSSFLLETVKSILKNKKAIAESQEYCKQISDAEQSILKIRDLIGQV